MRATGPDTQTRLSLIPLAGIMKLTGTRNSFFYGPVDSVVREGQYVSSSLRTCWRAGSSGDVICTEVGIKLIHASGFCSIFIFFFHFGLAVWKGEVLVKDTPQGSWIWRTGALQRFREVAVWESSLWGQLGLWDGELGDHIKGKFVTAYILEQEGCRCWYN